MEGKREKAHYLYLRSLLEEKSMKNLKGWPIYPKRQKRKCTGRHYKDLYAAIGG